MTFQLMKNYQARYLKACFSEVQVLNVDVRTAWYVCTPLMDIVVFFP